MRNFNQFKTLAVTTLFLLVCLGCSRTIPIPTKDAQFKERFQTELAVVPDHAWAGTYIIGDDSDHYVISLAPKSGYVFARYTDLGMEGEQRGSVVEHEGRITLVPDSKDETQNPGIFPKELTPVSWGRRHYLVNTDKPAYFFNCVNNGVEPRTSPFGATILRAGDENQPAEGALKVPNNFKVYLLDKPIMARVLSIGAGQREKSEMRHDLVIDAGSEKGVYQGLYFFIVDENAPADRLEVTAVEGDKCTVRYSYYYPLRDKDDEPKMSWMLTTRPSWDIRY